MTCPDGSGPRGTPNYASSAWLAEAIDELLEESFRDACPSAHMDGAYEKMLARAHGARLALRLLPPYQGASEQACRQFESGLRLLAGIDG